MRVNWSDIIARHFKITHVRRYQCSGLRDGLTEMVSTEAISTVLSQASSSEAACDSLINLALSGGGMDNVSVVLARYRFP